MMYKCFVCNVGFDTDTNEGTREKYRYVIGINLSPNSRLCYICSHVVNKMSNFKLMCLKRSSECPVACDYWPVKLQKSDLEIHIICPDDCNEHRQRNNNITHNFNYTTNSNDCIDYSNLQCVNLEDKELIDRNDSEYIDVIHELDYEDYIDTSVNLNSNDYVQNQVNHNAHKDLTIDNLENAVTDKSIVDNNEDTETLNNKDIGVFDNEMKMADNENTDANKYVRVGYNDSNTDNQLINDIDNELVNTEHNKKDNSADKVKKGTKSHKRFKRIVLSLEEQKAELESNRKMKKYIEAEFKCFNCALGFLFKDTYQAHMMRHEESNGEFQCVTCTLRFATLTSLRLHVACHSERHRCRKCGESLKPRAKGRHSCFKTAETQSVACHLCGNLLKDANGLQQHLKRAHASDASGRRYACNVCGDSYARQWTLRTHMIKHINRKFHCDQCPAVYSSPYTLTQHKKTHHTEGITHYCDTCGAGYATRKSLLAHIRNTSNHQTTSFECPICSRVCPNRKSMASHIQSVHSATKDHTCDLCPARYTNRKSLLRHIGTHNRKAEVKTVVCHVCGTSFKDNSKLYRHLRDVCKKAKEDQPTTLYD